MPNETLPTPLPAAGPTESPLPHPEGEPDLAAIAARHPLPPPDARGAEGQYVLSKGHTPALEVEDIPETDEPAPKPVTGKGSQPAQAAEKPADKPQDAPEKPASKGRLAPMLRREREVQAAAAQLKADEARIREDVRKAVLAEFAEDPGKIMNEAGVKPVQVAEKLVKPGKVAPVDPTAAKLAALEAEMAQLRSEREAAALEAEVAEMHQEITGMLAEDPARWPLLHRLGDPGGVIQVMLAHSEKTGEVPSDEDAADIEEARLADLLSKLAPPTGAAPKTGKAPASNKGPRTTSSAAASAAPARGKEPLPEDDDKALEILAARAERAIRAGREAGR